MRSHLWQPMRSPFARYKKQVFRNVVKTADFIYHIGESDALRQPSVTVPSAAIVTREFQQKVAYVKQCLLAYRKLTGMGRGISAVQIGIPERFSVIFMPERREKLLVMINPVVVKQSKTLFSYPEICMSANPLIASVVRPSWVECVYFDEKGQEKLWNMKANDRSGKMYNRVIQHEIDHLEGIINIDKVSSATLIYDCDPAFYEKASFTKVTR